MKLGIGAFTAWLQLTACIAFSAALGGCDSSSAGSSDSAAASSTSSTVTAGTTTAATGSKTTPSTAAASTSTATVTAATGVKLPSGANPTTGTTPASSTPGANSATAATAAAGATTTAPKTTTPATATASTPANASASAMVTATNDSDACLPMSMPSADALFSSTKRVFAHYLFPFPLSIDNKASASDYYNDNYLNRHGESNKWLAQGGFLRQRPLGTSRSTSSNWKLVNMETEVRSAIARGITGFTFDVMSLSEATETDGPLAVMLEAAHAVDPRFKIVVMPDLTTLGSDSSAVIQIISSVAASPAAYHLGDGRLVVSAFDAGINSPAWWKSIFAQLQAQGIKVAFVPTFMAANVAAYASLTYGYGEWGTATASAAAALLTVPDSVHTADSQIFMMPVNPQQFRPKDFLYWEAAGSTTFRNGWNSAIQGNADWIQLVTWNDFSESGQISPYTDTTLKRTIGTGYYDMNGFFAAWFLTGQQPQITHDVLYYFYRREPTSASALAQRQTDRIATGTAQNEIELVGFLTAPGVLKVTINGITYSQSAAAGIVSMKVPSQPGTPVFTLTRNGAEVFSFEGGVQIYGSGGLPTGVEDLTYWSGSAAKTGICSL